MTTDSPAPPPADAAPPDCAALLAQHFPALFGVAPKPLKLRIQADIQARAPGVFSKRALSAFLRQHTGRHAYLLALTRSSHRFDLDGMPCDTLSAEHRQAAADELARRRALREARLAREDEQRRERAQLLRAFENTALTAANFCALKGIDPAQLDSLLQTARSEAQSNRPIPPPHGAVRDHQRRAPRHGR